MALVRALSRFVYPARRRDLEAELSGEEIEAWVEAAGTEYFQKTDEVFVQRARALGITTGMVLDLNSQLGLVALKILWHEEGLLSMGVYRALDVSERARETAEDWGLGKRMFFQVGEPSDLKFKTGYFDMVVSDGTLHTSANPLKLLEEINRVTKPAGAILLAQRNRPARLRMRRAISAGRALYPDALKPRVNMALRAGYTLSELVELVSDSGLERTSVVSDGDRLFIERRGANDPSSWVSERERYL